MVSAHIVVEYSARVSVPILVPVSVHPELKANFLELKLATLALIVSVQRLKYEWAAYVLNNRARQDVKIKLEHEINGQGI